MKLFIYRIFLKDNLIKKVNFILNLFTLEFQSEDQCQTF
jgi:hypothetical protein